MNDQWLALVLLLAMAVFLIATAWWDLRDIQWFATTRLSREQGTVQHVVVNDAYSQAQTVTCIETILFKPPGQPPVTFDSKGKTVGSGKECDPVRSTVTVLYDPQHPEHADTVASLQGRHGWGLYSLSAGILMVLGCLVWLGWKSARRSPRS
jgi:hypothetical protein